MFIKLGVSKISGILMNTEDTKSKSPEKVIIDEKERYKGKLNKAENKERARVVKARRKKAGHEAVSSQKAHEYH